MTALPPAPKVGSHRRRSGAGAQTGRRLAERRCGRADLAKIELTTKIHLASDGRCRPLCVRPAAGPGGYWLSRGTNAVPEADSQADSVVGDPRMGEWTLRAGVLDLAMVFIRVAQSCCESEGGAKRVEPVFRGDSGCSPRRGQAGGRLQCEPGGAQATEIRRQHQVGDVGPRHVGRQAGISSGNGSASKEASACCSARSGDASQRRLPKARSRMVGRSASRNTPMG